MFIKVFPSGPFSTNAYIVACESTREAAVIDPSPDSFENIHECLTKHNFNLKKILLTHSHWDHIADVRQFKEQYSVLVYVHSLDAPNLQKPGADGLPCWIQIEPVEPDVLLQEGMQIPVGKLLFNVLHTPGHSPGCVCFYDPQNQILFSGDTLFQGTIGNLSFPTSQPDLMWESLEKLNHLPKNTRVLPGHGSETTLEVESDWLPHAKKLFDI